MKRNDLVRNYFAVFHARDRATAERMLAHENIPDKETHDSISESWNSALEKLQRLFARKP